MSIESNIERIATALESIAQSVAAGAPCGTTTTGAASPTQVATGKSTTQKHSTKSQAKATAPPATPAAEEPTVTRDDVREAFRTWRKTHGGEAGKQEAVAILEKHKARSISDAADSALPALLEAFSE